MGLGFALTSSTDCLPFSAKKLARQSCHLDQRGYCFMWPNPYLKILRSKFLLFFLWKCEILLVKFICVGYIHKEYKQIQGPLLTLTPISFLLPTTRDIWFWKWKDDFCFGGIHTNPLKLLLTVRHGQIQGQWCHIFVNSDYSGYIHNNLSCTASIPLTHIARSYTLATSKPWLNSALPHSAWTQAADCGWEKAHNHENCISLALKMSGNSAALLSFIHHASLSDNFLNTQGSLRSVCGGVGWGGEGGFNINTRTGLEWVRFCNQIQCQDS